MRENALLWGCKPRSESVFTCLRLRPLQSDWSQIRGPWPPCVATATNCVWWVFRGIFELHSSSAILAGQSFSLYPLPYGTLVHTQPRASPHA